MGGEKPLAWKEAFKFHGVCCLRNNLAGISPRSLQNLPFMKPATSHGVWFALNERGVVVGAARYGDPPEYPDNRDAALTVAAHSGVRAVQVPNRRAEHLRAMFVSLETGVPVELPDFSQ